MSEPTVDKPVAKVGLSAEQVETLAHALWPMYVGSEDNRHMTDGCSCGGECYRARIIRAGIDEWLESLAPVVAALVAEAAPVARAKTEALRERRMTHWESEMREALRPHQGTYMADAVIGVAGAVVAEARAETEALWEKVAAVADWCSDKGADMRASESVWAAGAADAYAVTEHRIRAALAAALDPDQTGDKP